MTEKNAVDARGLANYLLSKADVEAMPIGPMKLLKLVYICHGWRLGIHGEPLISNNVYAWPYGPVIPEVYKAFRQEAGAPIKHRAHYYDFEQGMEVDYPNQLTESQRKTVDRVWEVYKGFSAIELSSLTHQAGTPWSKATFGLSKDQIRDIPISNEMIKEHYRSLALKNAKAKSNG